MRHLTKQLWFVIGGIFVITLVAGTVWFLFPQTAVSPLPVVLQSPVMESIAATSPSFKKSAVTNRPVLHPLPLEEGDRVVSWNFKGAYTGNSELEKKAYAEIERFSDILATTTSSKMILLVAIANEYELLGKGEEQYGYLGRAALEDAKNGLPWHNLGALMERLGAYSTARIAYEKSVALQPQFPLYHYAYIEFLLQNMKSDVVAIEKAFAGTKANLGETPYLFELRAMQDKS